MKKIILSLLCVLGLLQGTNAQKEGLAAIGKSDLKAYMEFFASDNMAGRETGSDENNIAALFIKSHLMRLGLKPIPVTGDYLQEIPLVSTKLDRENCFLRVLDQNGSEKLKTDSVICLVPPSKTMEITGNVVFAGYGYDNKSIDYNDFDGIDVKGKIVLIMTRNPEAVKAGSSKTLFDERIEGAKLGSLLIRNPAAVLFVYDPENSFSNPFTSGIGQLLGQNTVSFRGKQGFSLPMQILFITPSIANTLLKPTGYNLKQMQERITEGGKPVSCEIKGVTATARSAVEVKDITAPNVIGIIEGTHPSLKNECIVYSAHFDHTGRNSKGEAYNGADDNASGSMALLEIAEAFMNLKQKPLRTIVFAWVNGEEKGLLGSKYYVDNPVIPMEKTVIDINLDMVGRSKMAADTGKFFGFDLDITLPGEISVYSKHESQELLRIMNNAALEAGIRLNDKGPVIPYGSSDHASFTARGVPALCFNSGIHSDLHQTGDDVEKIDFDKMEKSARMCFLIGYRIASRVPGMIIDKQSSSR